MKILFMGNRIKIHWPFMILLMWVAVISYSSFVAPVPVGVTLFLYNDILHLQGPLIPPAITITEGEETE